MEVDLSKVETIEELHELLKKEFNFPDFYGMNWDAFWDAITGLVELPETIIFQYWDIFSEKFVKDSEILKELFSDFNEEFAEIKCEVIYQ